MRVHAFVHAFVHVCARYRDPRVLRYYSALCKFASLALMKHLPLPACIFLAHRERRAGFAHAGQRRDAARLLARARDGRGHGRFN